MAAGFHPKARLWVEGRRAWRTRYRTAMPEKKAKRLWIHAASLGEFEQGRPVIEAFRQQFPDWQIVLTFFSPSGYEIRKNYAAADFVGYLPADTAANSRDFLEIVQPDIAIFIKYEFWYHYLSGLKQRGIPVLLISALFRPDHIFFKPWGGLWRTMLAQCTHIFVQNAPSFQLLQHIGFQNITIAGDTRIDRVVHLAAQAAANEVVAAFSDRATVLIAGSTWPADEALLVPAFERVVEQHADYKLLLAPHEPTPQHLRQLLPRLSALPYCLYSQATVETARQAKILIIDNIGMLNTLYRYGQVAYIGGGFGKGIHNTLEPAAFGLPVVFGPRYQKFEEARAFVAQKGAFPVENEAALTQILLQLAVADARQAAAVALSRYLQAQKGATAKIMNYLEGLITA